MYEYIIVISDTCKLLLCRSIVVKTYINRKRDNDNDENLFAIELQGTEIVASDCHHYIVA